MRDLYAIAVWKSYPFDMAMNVFIKMEDILYKKTLRRMKTGELSYEDYKEKVELMKKTLLKIWGSNRFWTYYLNNIEYDHFLRYLKQLN